MERSKMSFTFLVNGIMEAESSCLKRHSVYCACATSFFIDLRGETSEVFVVGTSVSSKPVSKHLSVRSKHLLAVHLKLAFGPIHVCSSALEWHGEGQLFESDSNKRRGKMGHYSFHPQGHY